jgi:hypothetical protein
LNFLLSLRVILDPDPELDICEGVLAIEGGALSVLA